MKKSYLKTISHSWFGITAALVSLAAAIWLTTVYIHARRVTPIDKALVDSLKEKARTDSEVQKILQPETDRQHQALVVRRASYRAGGIILLISGALFLVWYKWLRSPSASSGRAQDPTRGPEMPSAPWGLDSTFPADRPPPASGSVDLRPVAEILEAEGRGPEAAIPVLQSIQSRYRYLPQEVLRKVCAESEITPAQIAGIATFYGQFRQTPVGKHLIRVCEGTACHVAGAVEVGNELRRCLRMPEGEDTDPARRFTIERVACVGSCSLAPVVTIDEKFHGKVSALSAVTLLRDFEQAAVSRRRNGSGKRHTTNSLPNTAAWREEGGPVEIRVGLGSCGIASGAQAVREAIEESVAAFGGGVNLKLVGCRGLCHREPLVEVVENGNRVLYGNVTADDARKIVRKHCRPRGLLRLAREAVRYSRDRLGKDETWDPVTRREVDATPYVGKQVRVVLENCGEIDPLSLDDYRGRAGMRALEECLKHLTPEEVIEKVRTSGLRGRGGAGFPTALKWEITRRAQDPAKYVICNGDEGDPGAFMDRAVLEADPFRVVEGLIIAAYAIGAHAGYVYVRREYPIAVRHVRAAIASAEAHGLLGKRIFGTDFSFELRVREGAGAFVCGEETALIQSIEGKRGMPRPRPPYPAHRGLWDKPTLINNVETLACLPWIIRHGPEAFAAMGTEKSKGTKVFSLVGKVNRGGLIEVPMGITIGEIVEEIGGGIKNGGTFKAVLAGGPSGGCIPARLAGTRIDYEELTATGSIMGSGGLVVLDEHDCAVEIARYFLQFTQNESCGKCTFCRVGTRRMLEILERICRGEGSDVDLKTLEELSNRVKKGSLCGLGQTAPNPVLTTMRYFREEYEAHIHEKRCPAGACKALIHYSVLDNCTGCTLCAQACPAAAIKARPYEKHAVEDDLCTRCGMCVTACPEHAIEVA